MTDHRVMWERSEQLELIAVAHRAMAAAIGNNRQFMHTALDPLETVRDAVFVILQLAQYAVPIVRLQTDSPTGALQLVALDTSFDGQLVSDDDSVAVNDLYCTVLCYLSTGDWDAAAVAIVQAERLAYPLVEFSALMLASHAAGRLNCQGMHEYRERD